MAIHAGLREFGLGHGTELACNWGWVFYFSHYEILARIERNLFGAID